MAGGESKYKPRRLRLKRHDEGNDYYGKVARLAVARRKRKKKEGK